MSVLMISDMPGTTRADYDHLVAVLGQTLAASPGFVTHGAGPVDGGFRVVEVWDSAEEHAAWFDAHVRPAPPAGAPEPTITVVPVVNTIRADR